MEYVVSRLGLSYVCTELKSSTSLVTKCSLTIRRCPHSVENLHFQLSEKIIELWKTFLRIHNQSHCCTKNCFYEIFVSCVMALTTNRFNELWLPFNHRTGVINTHIKYFQYLRATIFYTDSTWLISINFFIVVFTFLFLIRMRISNGISHCSRNCFRKR